MRAMQTILRNARVFDGFGEDCPGGMSVLVEDGRIREVSDKAIGARDAIVLDVGGRTLMPGLIDAHMHAYAADVNVQRIEDVGPSYRAAHAVRILGFQLDCGFTTVRDVGGGDWSLSRAIADGLVRAPRFFYSGKVMSMTGGHGDMRLPHMACSCGVFNSFARMADGGRSGSVTRSTVMWFGRRRARCSPPPSGGI